jgi:hypothetical protein
MQTDKRIDLMTYLSIPINGYPKPYSSWQLSEMLYNGILPPDIEKADLVGCHWFLTLKKF